MKLVNIEPLESMACKLSPLIRPIGVVTWAMSLWQNSRPVTSDIKARQVVNMAMFISDNLNQRVISSMAIQVTYEASYCNNAIKWTLWHVFKLYLEGPMREYGCFWIKKVLFVVLVTHNILPTRGGSLCWEHYF